MRVFKNLFGDNSKIHASEVILNTVKSGQRYRTLNDLFGGETIDVNGKNMNDIKDNGIFRGYNMTNGVAGQSISTFIVMRYSNDWVVQIQFAVTDPVKFWIRAYVQGSYWTNWVQQ